MYFDSFEAVLHMEGHGPYVWAAYLITLLVIMFILLAPLRRQHLFLRQMAGELRRAGTATTPEEESNASGS